MPKKILLADDSVTIQKVVSITLAHEDFDLTIVDNGSKALAKAKEIKPDVILLDVVMPDKDGYQVCREIKGIAELKNTPIILLTGTFEPFDADRAAESGADDFIKKPFESHTLINKVKEMASRKRAPRERPVDISDVDIGFETPIEAEYKEPAPGKKSSVSRAAAPTTDFDTPWEEESKPGKPAKATEGDAEDIWSVEEFEDIAGTKSTPGASASPAKSSPEDNVWEEEIVQPAKEPSAGKPAPKLTPEPVPKAEKKSAPAAAPSVDDFELGEEISEDELEKFLEEEGVEEEVAVEEETVDDSDLLVEEMGDALFESDRESAPIGGRDQNLMEEEIFEEDFGEAIDTPHAGDKGKTLKEESVLDEQIELDWEEPVRVDRPKAPSKGRKTEEFDDLLLRTPQDELSEFGEGEDELGALDEGESSDEFEFELNSERGDAAAAEVGVESDDFMFDEVDETPSPKKEPSRVEAVNVKDEGPSALNQKDVSKAVDKVVREVIEKVVWEVVPELAEELIKQEIKRLKGEKG